MDDIRFLGTDGEFLVLESANGEKYRLLVDEFLRKAVRRDSVVAVPENLMSPRTIQTAIRRGSTIDELVAQSTSSRSYIRKFAAPVLDELQHMISSALSVRVSISGDRFSESSQAEFGDILADRLTKAGATGVLWSSKKNDQDVWLISCSFDHPNGHSMAIWSFVPKRLAIAAENDVAVALSSQNAVLPKLKALDTPQVRAELTENLAETIEFKGVIPFGRSTDLAPFATPVAHEPKPVEGQQAEVVAETEDLLESLRRKRVERENANVQKSTEVPDLIEALPAKGAESDKASGAKSPETKPVSGKTGAGQKRGRPSIPSWDEIVFGSNKSEE